MFALESLARGTGLGEHLGPAFKGVAFHVLYYRPRDLLATPRRRFDRVCVVRLLGANQTQVEQGQAAGERRADDAVVEHRQGGDRHLLQCGVGEARVVDGADRRG